MVVIFASFDRLVEENEAVFLDIVIHELAD